MPLALTPPFLYKPGFKPTLSCLFRSFVHGCPKKKNLAVPPRHAPLRRRAEAADLCRGQGLRRAAPPASHRPEDRDVPGPSGAQGEERSLKPRAGGEVMSLVGFPLLLISFAIY